MKMKKSINIKEKKGNEKLKLLYINKILKNKYI